MKAIIHPSQNNKVSIRIPTSKSMAHRAILCASLAQGKSHITSIDYNEDIRATMVGMRHLGARIDLGEHDAVIEGIPDFEHFDHEVVDCNESGSTLRFFIPLFSLTKEEVHFTGHGKLMQRPQSVYEEVFNNQGLQFSHSSDELILKGALKAGTYTIKGNISSQFITGLLMMLPLLEEDSLIKIEPPFESASYVNLTIQMQKVFGVDVHFVDSLTLAIKGNQRYQAKDVAIEGDYSQMAFFAGLGVMNQDVEALGMDKNSLQGDKVTVDILRKMNADIEESPNGYLFKRSNLLGTEIDLGDCPDLGPMFFAIASCAEGTTTFTHCERLRIKESDRIACMEEELRKLGVNIFSKGGTVVVEGKSSIHPKEVLYGHNDHRIVMALSVLSTLSDQEVIIEGAQAINKSYPTFFEDLKSAGIEVELC